MSQLAVFTMVHDAQAWYDRWLTYYCSQVSPRDIYVLTHNLAGEQRDQIYTEWAVGELNLIAVDHPMHFDAAWVVNTAISFQQFLLQSYDYVLFAGADEFIVYANGSLEDFLHLRPTPAQTGRRYDALTCTGYEIVHRQEEFPLQLDKPILEQRRFWTKSPRYSKALLSNGPLYWAHGFQSAGNLRGSTVPDPDLLLLHVHKADHATCLALHNRHCSRWWDPEEKLTGIYRHNRIDDADTLWRWLRCNADVPEEYAVLEDIPEHIRKCGV